MVELVFVVLLVSAVWAVVLLLDLPLWIAILSTVMILLCVVAVFAFRVVRARRGARAIEAALRAQAEQAVAGARPDHQRDIEAMKTELLQAIAALKTSRLGYRRPSEALDALPWYLIIGPPGAGKSTALRTCGLRFPYLSKNGGGIQGLGGTRNCQWWMSNDGVFLDTAGRYTTEDSDHDEWMAFLELLARSRPQAPINGVLVAISIADLMHASPTELVAKAREIRARVDEVIAKLQMRVPVYSIFTKCDLIPGFVEMFGDLDARERNQILGFTFPAASAIESPAEAFAECFAELARGIERRAVRRMGEERSLDARAQVLAFPQHFEPLRDPLAIFAGELFATSIYSEPPIMRGCYFASGTQEGRPIDLVMQSMARAFGLQPRLGVGSNAASVEAKSYFLGELLTRVVLPDRRLACLSAKRLRRQRRVAHGIGLGLVGMAIGMVACPVVAFRDNHALQLEARAAVAEVAQHYASKQETGDIAPIRIEHLVRLMAMERKLAEHRREGAPWRSRMGMYQGDELHPPLRELYSTVVREELMVPMAELQRRALQRFRQRYGSIGEPPPRDEHAAAKDGLHMLLLLDVPPAGRPEGEPGFTEAEQTWLVEHIVAEWERALRRSGDTASRKQMGEVAQAYVAILTEEPERSFERDEALVQDVREILQRTDRTQDILDRILADVTTSALDLKQLTNTRGALSSRHPAVSGRYTRAAWETQVRSRLYGPGTSVAGDQWVLGVVELEQEDEHEQRMAQVRSAYFDQYIEEWTGFLNSINVGSPGDLGASLVTLEDLTRGQSTSLQFLCEHVAFQTTLLPPTAPEPGATRGASRAELESIEEEDVAAAFQELVAFGCPPAPTVPEGSPPLPAPDSPLDEYVEALEQLRVAVKAKVDRDAAEDTKAVAVAVQAAGKTVDALILDHDGNRWTPLLHRWMRPPIRGVESSVLHEARTGLSAAWCEQVVRPWRSLAGRYPFDPEGADVPLADFVAFFEPERGQLWAFHASWLANRIPRRDAQYELEERGAEARNEIDPAVVAFLERARDVTTVMFPVEAEGVRVELELQQKGARGGATDVSHTTISIDGTRMDYDNGPDRWATVIWPGEQPGALLGARGSGLQAEVGPYEGPWALFRLLEAGTVSKGAGVGAFKIEWDIRDQGAGIVTVIVRPKLMDTPFFGARERAVGFMEVFRHEDLTPPRAIVVGGERCKAR
jgi:type VI secretion system protein ImpL